MNFKLMSSYVTGLVHMASSCSRVIAPSYAVASCYSKDDFKKSFIKEYRLSSFDFSFHHLDISLEKLVSNLFGEEDSLVVEGLLYWIHVLVGDCRDIYTIDDKKVLDALGWSSRGRSPFYTVDDIYFMVFDDAVICFIIGNNE